MMRSFQSVLSHHHLVVLRISALLGLLMAFPSLPAQANYRQKALEQTAYLQSHFYDASAHKYHDTYPVNPNGLPWTTMWANGVQWRVIVEATQDNPAKYRPILDAYAQGLQEYWDPQPQGSPPGFNAYCSGPGGTDKYYDDNAWMVLGFLEAYKTTHDPKYLQWARTTQAFVLSGWDDTLGGGIYWSLKHQSKNTCDNAPGAVGALQLAALGEPDQENWALRIIPWVNTTLKDDKGLYWDNIALDGKITKWEFTYNTALMIEADILLFKMRGDRQALHAAEQSANAAIAQWQDPVTGAFANNADFTHLLCESLIQLYQVNHDIHYLDAVRRHAAFGDRYIRDAQNGGYWNDWVIKTHQADERKALLQNASDARIFWLLAPYPDVDELVAKGMHALAAGKNADAQDFLQQAADSDTEAIEPRYTLWKLLGREHKTAEAQVQEQKLVTMSANPKLNARLTTLGWVSPTPSTPNP
jgi:uncharacterized protein YyaL (SSP411 family)